MANPAAEIMRYRECVAASRSVSAMMQVAPNDNWSREVQRVQLLLAQYPDRKDLASDPFAPGNHFSVQENTYQEAKSKAQRAYTQCLASTQRKYPESDVFDAVTAQALSDLRTQGFRSVKASDIRERIQ